MFFTDVELYNVVDLCIYSAFGVFRGRKHVDFFFYSNR